MIKSDRCGGKWTGVESVSFPRHTSRGSRGTSPWRKNRKQEQVCLDSGDYLLLAKTTTRATAVHRGTNPGSCFRLLTIKTQWREGDVWYTECQLNAQARTRTSMSMCLHSPQDKRPAPLCQQTSQYKRLAQATSLKATRSSSRLTAGVCTRMSHKGEKKKQIESITTASYARLAPCRDDLGGKTRDHANHRCRHDFFLLIVSNTSTDPSAVQKKEGRKRKNGNNEDGSRFRSLQRDARTYETSTEAQGKQ